MKPPTKDKGLFCARTPAQLWGYRKWTQQFFQRLTSIELDRLPTVPAAKSDYDRRVTSLVIQYGRTINEIYQRSGSTWDGFGQRFRQEELDLQPVSREDVLP